MLPSWGAAVVAPDDMTIWTRKKGGERRGEEKGETGGETGAKGESGHGPFVYGAGGVMDC